MRSKIMSMEFSRLRNEEHFGFHSEFVELASECVLSEAFASLVKLYRRSYEVLSDSLEVIRKSVFTAEMAEADRWRTGTYRRLRFAVEEYRAHRELGKREAAERVFIIIRNYGSLVRAPRETKTSALANMVGVLREKGAEDLVLLGLWEWVEELERNNEHYRELKVQRYAEHAEQSGKDVRAVRRAVDADYEAITYAVAVHMKLNPADESGGVLVGETNERVASYRMLLAQRKGIRSMQRRQEEACALAERSGGDSGREEKWGGNSCSSSSLAPYSTCFG